jgi:ribonuclease P/MRP protein subunit RPP1
MFCDLNIISDSNNLEEVKRTLALAVKLGYDCVALNHVVEGRLGPQDVAVPKPIEFEILSSPLDKPPTSTSQKNTRSIVNNKEEMMIDNLKTNEEKDKKTNDIESQIKLASSTVKRQYVASLRMESQRKQLKQYSRLSIHLDDNSQLYTLTANNPILLSYDIVAVCPSNEKLFQQCCQNLEIDIISLDLSHKLPFSVKTPIVQQAIARGIHFEICYSSALKDNNSRRHFMSNVIHLVRTTKGRNLIFTSEAKRAMHLRGPYDVINLGTLFGLDPAISKNCIASNCVTTLYHGETRKTAKGVISITKLSAVTPPESWKIPSETLHRTQPTNTNAIATATITTVTNNANALSAMEIDDLSKARKRHKRKKQKSVLSRDQSTASETQHNNEFTNSSHKRKLEETEHS